ncbi:MAG: DUF998 domain-containing protein [Candidatus Hodarchaeota archaeon]
MNIYLILAICGMLSPIVYTAMWILGGIILSDYNHIRDDISSLFAVDAPNRRLFQSFIIISSVLLFIFYLGLHEAIPDGPGSIIGPLLFLASSFLGILVATFFPLDAGGEFITLKGKMHLVLVAAMGILTIAGMVAIWIRLASIEGWNTFAWYSLITAIVSFILVGIAAMFAKGRYRGLVERLGVTPYQLYYFFISLMVFLTN